MVLAGEPSDGARVTVDLVDGDLDVDVGRAAAVETGAGAAAAEPSGQRSSV